MLPMLPQIKSSDPAVAPDIPELPSDATKKRIIEYERSIESWGLEGLGLEEGPKWVGGVYPQDEVRVNDEGDKYVFSYKIASVIDSRLIYPTRRGGDSYWKIKNYHLPRSDLESNEASTSSTTSNSSFSLGDLDQSYGKTKNYNAGVLGLQSVGSSRGSSGQATTFMDINGDGYPDFLLYTGRGLRYLPGTGRG